MHRPIERSLAVVVAITVSACAERSVTEPVRSEGVDLRRVDASAGVALPSVTICHVDKGKPGYRLISVGPNAVPSHLAHGDALPGGILGGDCRFLAYFLDPRTTYETTAFGGQGGVEFTDNCPAGAVAVGMGGSVAIWYGLATVALLRLECREFLPDGTLGATTTTPPRGGGGAAAVLVPFSGTCPAGQMLAGVSGTHSAYLSSIAGRCATLARVTDALGGSDSIIGPFAGTGDFGSNTSFSRPCRDGYVITGIYGRHGDVIDAAGFRCTMVRTP